MRRAPTNKLTKEQQQKTTTTTNGAFNRCTRARNTERMLRAVAGVVAAAAVGAVAYTSYQRENERLVGEQMRQLMEEEEKGGASHRSSAGTAPVATPGSHASDKL